MRFEFKVLGSNSAIPCYNRFPSSFSVSYHDKSYLIDCGEGCQLQLSKYKVKRSRIEQIFISHLHGDHIFGLPGLLTSFALQERKKPLTLFGPVGLKQFVDTAIEVSESYLTYDLSVIEHTPEGLQKIFEDDYLLVYSFPLVHRISTSGYLFKEKQSKIHLDSKAIERYGLRGSQIKELREGGIVLDYMGSPISIQDIALTPKPPRKFAYCSDTKYDDSYIGHIRGCNLIYHEATYTSDLQSMAEERMHSTAAQAAEAAQKSASEALVIGHFSSRYKELDGLLDEAKSIFGNTSLAIEGESFEIRQN